MPPQRSTSFSDTSLEAQAVSLSLYRSMSPAAKARIVASLTRSVHALALAGLRRTAKVEAALMGAFGFAGGRYGNASVGHRSIRKLLSLEAGLRNNGANPAPDGLADLARFARKNR